MNRQQPALATDPTTWIDNYGDYLFRFAMTRARNTEVAEELVQETFLAALSARSSFRGRSTERSWLTAILKRKIVDWLRRQIRQRANQEPLPDDWTDQLFTRGGKWKAKPHEWHPHNPDLKTTRQEFWQTFQGCLDKLPARLRQAFVLRHLDDRAICDIGLDLGATASNLWVMLHRARLRLCECLSENWFEQVPLASKAE